MKTVNRRHFLKASGMSACTAYLLVGCGGSDSPSNITYIPAQSLYKKPKEGSYPLRIQGQIPSDLKGSLYCNGPTLFERNGLLKKHLLDGDGFITKISFQDGKASFKGRFVSTDKYKQEEQAGRFVNDSFTTVLDDNDDRSILTDNNDANQSSVSVHHINGKLYAFDESNVPYVIDPSSLEATKAGGAFERLRTHGAHGKTDPKTGEFVNFGIQFGDPTQQGLDQLDNYIHLHILKDDQPIFHKRIKTTGLLDPYRGVYIHDFFVTDHYIAIVLPPMLVDLRHVGPANRLFGYQEKALGYSFKWKGSLHNKIMIVDRKNPNAKEIVIDAPSAKGFWHTINAYENKHDELILDFMAYDDFGFFTHRDPHEVVMRTGTYPTGKDMAPFFGRPLRYTIGLSDRQTTGFYAKASVQESVLSDTYSGEFPMLNPKFTGSKSPSFYNTITKPQRGIFQGLGRFDYDKGDYAAVYFFGDGHFCNEAVFCSKKGSQEEGYLIMNVHNLTQAKTFFAIFDSEAIAKGPVATLHLDTSLPYRLHGTWVEG